MSGTNSVTTRRRDHPSQSPAEEDVNSQMVIASTALRRGTQSPFSLMKIVGTIGTIALALWIAHGFQYEKVIDPLDFKSRTERVLATTPLIDGHNDLPYLLRIELKNKIYDRSILNFRKSRRSQFIQSLEL
jgi:membrane dipeptidase